MPPLSCQADACRFAIFAFHGETSPAEPRFRMGEGIMADNDSGSKAREGAESAPKKPKKEKVSIDPAQRGKGGFDRGQLRGKAPIFRTLKKAGR